MGRTEISAQSSGKGWRSLVPGLVVSLVCLAVVFYFADLHKLLLALRQANYLLVLASLGSMLAWLLVRAAGWRTILGDRPTYAQVFWTVSEGYLLNNLLPFRLGELGRALLLSRKAGMDFWEVLSSIVVERALDLALTAGMLLSLLPFVVGASWAWQAAAATAVLVLIGLGVLYLGARYRDWSLNILQRLTSPWPRLQEYASRFAVPFLDGLAVLTDLKRFLRTIAWFALNWLIAIVQDYFLLLAFVPNARPLWSAFALCVMALGGAAPSSPGGLGVWEVALVGALAVFGVDASLALAFALTIHLMQYLLTGMLGAYGLAHDGETMLGLYHELRSLRHT